MSFACTWWLCVPGWCSHERIRAYVYAYDTDVRRYGWTGRLDREGGSCPDREMRIVSVYELSGVGEQIAQSN